MKCENCRFYYKGECHRYPPKKERLIGVRLYCVWVRVEPNDWCGEFQQQNKGGALKQIKNDKRS